MYSCAINSNAELAIASTSPQGPQTHTPAERQEWVQRVFSSVARLHELASGVNVGSDGGLIEAKMLFQQVIEDTKHNYKFDERSITCNNKIN